MLAGKDKVRVLPSFVGKVIVGYCLVSVSDDIGEIDSLSVEQQFRGSGIAAGLMDFALAWMADNGAEQYQLSVVSGNEDAFSFYARFNFKPRNAMMSR